MCEDKIIKNAIRAEQRSYNNIQTIKGYRELNFTSKLGLSSQYKTRRAKRVNKVLEQIIKSEEGTKIAV